MTTQTAHKTQAKESVREHSPSILEAVIEKTQEAKDAGELAEQIEECREAIEKESNHITSAWLQATAIQEIVERMPKKMQAALVRMQNNPRFFKTDRPNKKHPQLYDQKTICEVAAQALMAGYRLVDNEWNIISGNFYPALNGLKRLCEEMDGVSELELRPGVPMASSGGALVPMLATWKQGGKSHRMEWRQDPDGFDLRIPVRVNEGQGADAIHGKAKRKAYAAILRRLQGKVVTDDDESVVMDLVNGDQYESSTEDEPTTELFEKGQPDANAQ